MSKPNPLCALCGETLARTECVVIEFTMLPGRPRIGWHLGACSEADEEFAIAHVDHDKGAVLRIEARGPGRVVAGAAWKAPARKS